MPDSTPQLSLFKTCIHCGESKPLSEFPRRRDSPDGYRNDCKACKAEHRRAHYEANRERAAERARAWREANPERAAEHNRAWRKANPEKRAEHEARRLARHPDRRAARTEVSKAVKRGDLPPASALVCDHCQEAQAEQYHHHLGYAREHWLDVIPVCIPCHVELDRGES